MKDLVDDPDASTLAAALCGPAYFAKATASADKIARFRIERESDLKVVKIGVIEERGDLLGENRSFDELHIMTDTPMAYACN